MTDETNTKRFDAIEFRASLDRMREKGVAVANEQDVNARMALAGLIDNDASPTTITIAALAAFGNPKTPKGKACETLSGLRYAKGGDAARKSLEAVFVVHELRETAGAIDLISAFIDKEKDAPKGIFALRDAVKALAKAAMGDAAKDAPADGEGEGQNDGNGEGGASTDGNGEGAAPTLGDMVAMVAKAITEAPVSELAAIETELANLFAAIGDASDAIAASLERKAA